MQASTPPPASTPSHFEYRHVTPISTPTSRSYPLSPSELTENNNDFSSNAALPSNSRAVIISHTPLSQNPLTPPDSSGKITVKAGSGPTPLGEPIKIRSTSPAPTNTEVSPRIRPAGESPCSSLAGVEVSSKRASPAPNLSPSRKLVQSSPSTFSHSVTSSLSIAPAAPTHEREITAQSDVSSTSSVTPPNVYINGLPANFPEEQLYNMTKEFGPIMSVRTFTRHISERPTGYGFVLFETLDSAERCIETLRKYRNLHPSLSKQVHKIPGTAYAHVQTNDDFQDNASMDQGMTESFKARMERCKDESSTNLYVEGLPLSIDEPTLIALMSPYKIMSSRLFQTRLSHPPRIIAFVRLETRTAAEEIVERLHGRMVRGWNDPGCRISVRFADTAEQRELRRQERATQGASDHSPARLTIAQASLLSLQGSQALPPKQARRGGRVGNRATGQYEESVAYSPNDNRSVRKREQPVQNPLQSMKPRSGYNPAEELILAVHAQQMQSRGASGVPGMQVKNFDNFTQSHVADHMPRVGHHNMVHDHYSGHETYDYEDEEMAQRLSHGFKGLSMSGFQGHGQHLRSAQHPSTAGSYAHLNKNPSHNKNRNTYNTYDANTRQARHRGDVGDVPHHDQYSENESGQSPLFSPALTYSSLGRTPQTLSPATPFFASFPLADGFESFKGRERAPVATEEYRGPF